MNAFQNGGTSRPKLTWVDGATFSVGGHKITMDYEYGGSKRASGQSDFTMMKSRSFLDQYLAHVEEDFKHILELGVYQGGSFVFLNEVFQPERISGIELSEVPIPALDKYISERQGRANLYYGTSQDNESRLAEIIEHDFGGRLDLVVDDASHFYNQTKVSFRAAFQKLRPGGLYIIEDWSWSFFDDYQAPDHPWSEHHSLANLSIDLMEEMALGSMIAEVIVSPHMIKIRRSGEKSAPVFVKENRRGREYKLI
ncbi:class I SAM-dependent methyltransferase [Agrobacterium tumefaciens]|jgi:predicted O-methyltransferase YrrM|uniref:class I SAM-dependent methyltransferase n=1 Tax=Agrobacterium tumefaciens complex TaxID=1183400 RepID=UPI000DD64F97|nr:class I SAM-dependent methyltransferase [Agrobacterium tumefaciens]MDR6587383.1 SAM-dependent methyltransferase [Agrobacterium tumefaciens]QNP81829.1 class I SAM-dependent methyltransferase [Agrobacterium tumefaciens]